VSNAILRSRIWSRIQAGVDEAEAHFRSTCGSDTLADGETAAALFLSDGSIVTDGTHSAPFLSMLLRPWVDQVRSGGDTSGVVVSNDPYGSGGSVADLKMATPVVIEGEVVAWCAMAGHYPDVGGRMVGGVAPGVRTIQEEGIRLPVCASTPNLFHLISENARLPSTTLQDLEAQQSAVGVLGEWLTGLSGTYGWEVIAGAIDQVQVRGQAGLKKAMTELKPGIYVRRDRLDSDVAFEPVPLVVTLSVDDTGLVLDFDGTGPTSVGPTNCTRESTIAATICGLRHIFPEIPACGFRIEDLEIRVPHGSLLDASFPAPVGGTTDVLADRVTSLVIEALSQAVHGRGQACDGGGGDVIVLESHDPDHPFALRFVVGTGGGASGRGDGLLNADVSTRHSRFPSIEDVERTYPVRLRHYGERDKSGGAGRYRGANGTVLEVEWCCKGRLSLYVDRFSRGAGGHHRGGRGSVTELEVYTDGHWQRPAGIGRLQSLEVVPGDRVRIRTAGGGGYGHPYERAVRLLQEDVSAGRLTRKEAAKDHGVVFTSPDGRDYDSAKTFKLRSYRLTSSDVDDFLDEIETLED